MHRQTMYLRQTCHQREDTQDAMLHIHACFPGIEHDDGYNIVFIACRGNSTCPVLLGVEALPCVLLPDLWRKQTR